MAELKVGQEIKYDLRQGSGMDRKKARYMLKNGYEPVSTGTIKYIRDDHVIISGSGYLGHKSIPFGAIL